MNDLIPINTGAKQQVAAKTLEWLSHLDSRSLLALTGMGCATAVLCVGCVCLTGSEMSLSADGFSVTQPGKVA